MPLQASSEVSSRTLYGWNGSEILLLQDFSPGIGQLGSFHILTWQLFFFGPVDTVDR
jgi:hypothetical protein